MIDWRADQPYNDLPPLPPTAEVEEGPEICNGTKNENNASHLRVDFGNYGCRRKFHNICE